MDDRDGMCDIECSNPESVKRVLSALPPEEVIDGVAELFAILSDRTRMKILMAIGHEPLCVCDIAAITGLSRSAVSHQLRLLRNPALVKVRKEGKMAYYSLSDDHVVQLVRQAREHWEE